MGLWFSVPEIAEALGCGARRLQIKSKNWQGGRPRLKGKGLEYPLESLSPEIQVALLKIKGAQDPLPVPAAPHSVPPTRNPEPIAQLDLDDYEPPATATKAEREISAKCWVLQACRKLSERTGCGITEARHTFVSLYKKGEIKTPGWVREQIQGVSWASITRWEKQMKENLNRLARKTGGRKGDTIIDKNPQVMEFILGTLAQAPHVSPRQIFLGLQVRFPEVTVSVRAVQRWLQAWKAEHPQEWTYMVSPADWRNKYKPAYGSYSEGVEQLNDLWQLDSTRSDVIWELADGKRYHVLACIDVFSRRAKVLISETSNSEAIAALVHSCLMQWGVPKRIKTDNGKDYVSHHLSNILMSLGIKHETCTPFTPEQKPHIERFIGTFNHSLMQMLPHYVGANVIQRQQIRARELWKDAPASREVDVVQVKKAIAEFQAWCNQWVDWYLQQPHEGLGRKRPLEMLALQPVRTIENVRQLDVLMQPAPQGGMRTIQKAGVRVGSLPDGTAAFYVSDDLPGIAQAYPEVYVKLDPDLGKIHLFDQPNCATYLGTAYCPELTGIDRAAVAAKAQTQAKQVKAVVKTIRNLGKNLNVADTPQRVLDAAKVQIDKVRLMPGTSEAHTSPGLEAAGQLLEAMDTRPRPSVPDAAITAELERLEAQTQKPVARNLEALLRQALECFAEGGEFSEEEKSHVSRYLKTTPGRADLMTWGFELTLPQQKAFKQWLDGVASQQAM